MQQSSLMTWLNKPKTVSQPQVPSTPPAPHVEEYVQQHASPEIQDEKPTVAIQTKPLFASTEKPLPPNVELRACTKQDIPHLKNLTSLLLPIPYPDKFYKEILTDPITNSITLLALWHDDPALKTKEKGRLVGAIRCRLLAGFKDEEPMLYLSTLVLLSPYRNHGIASHLLQALTRRAVDEYGVTSIGAHVWEANTDALEWYRKRGFCEVGREEGYYRRLEPKGAVVVQRKVGVMDLVGKGG